MKEDAAIVDYKRPTGSRARPPAPARAEAAKAAGISEPVLYAHFGSKENLFSEAVLDEYRNPPANT